LIVKVSPAYRKEVHLYMASCYMNMNKLDVAKYYLEKCLKMVPRYYEAHLQLGSVCLKLKDYSSSVSFLNEAISLEPGRVEPHILKADCLLQNNQYA
jgi:tetratricopeptide (TPR) repeat protein